MNIIVSVNDDWGIGSANRLLFHLPPDMEQFKAKTMGGAVVMGRKTFESLPYGEPLKGRINIVMSRNPARFDAQLGGIVGGEAPCLRMCGSLDELAHCLKTLDVAPERIWAIGGAEIYRLLLPYSNEAFVTKVFARACPVDCWMANLDGADGWELAESGALREWEGLKYRFNRYQNRNVAVL
jgi:dihydrofolate reductase